jgi:prolyl 4-hydroxylase
MSDDSAPPIPPALRARILALASAGRGPEGALQPLLDAGWGRDQALAALEPLLQEFVAQLAHNRSLPAPVPVPAPIALNGSSVLSLPDCEVEVLMNLVHPRVIVFGGLLSRSECEGLIAHARGLLKRSSVVNPLSGVGELHDARTSEGATFERGSTALVRRVEQRIAALMSWPNEHGESLQILRYGPGAEYRPHHDYFDPKQPGTAANVARGGQRVASLVMYLNTPAHGGATVFPEAKLEIAALRGNAVFFSYDVPHPMTRTLHGGAPVIRGEKWIATKWFRERACD